MTTTKLILIALAFAILASGCLTHQPSFRECQEAGGFPIWVKPYGGNGEYRCLIDDTTEYRIDFSGEAIFVAINRSEMNEVPL